MEVGKRLLEPDNKPKDLNGIHAGMQGNIWSKQRRCSKKWIFNGIWMNWIKSLRPARSLRWIFFICDSRRTQHLVVGS